MLDIDIVHESLKFQINSNIINMNNLKFSFDNFKNTFSFHNNHINKIKVKRRLN